jgi:C-terminal processing protease CtpA/Prc
MASAAETLAGVLKDKKVGVLAGRRTFGKKVGQSSTSIGGNLFLKLTTGKFILPSGEGVPEEGLEPDLRPPVFTEDIEVAIEWIEEHKGERFPQEQGG